MLFRSIDAKNTCHKMQRRQGAGHNTKENARARANSRKPACRLAIIGYEELSHRSQAAYVCAEAAGDFYSPYADGKLDHE